MTSTIFRIYGDVELLEFLRNAPEKVRGAVLGKMQQYASELSRYIKDEKLSGQVYNSVSGRLKNSIYGRVYVSGSKITLSVGSRGVEYAGILEHGGTTSPHDIYAVKANVLAFMLGGKKVFAKHVSHPGSNFTGKSYIREALIDKQEDITNALSDEVIKVMHGHA